MAGTTTGRFGRTAFGDELLSLRYDAREIVRLTNRVTGAFRGGAFQRVLAQVHEEQAAQIQTGMADHLRRRIDRSRTQRPGQRLAMALLDERNRDVSASGFTVMRPAWLERSPAALYWRRIEEGDQTTFSGLILFTSDFNKYYAPWSPGGTSGQSTARHARSGGTSRLYSRTMPPGYKHMRMPQHRGVFVANIGPFPAYDYTQGGALVFRKQGAGRRALYQRRLKDIGINLSTGDFR